MSGLPLSAIGGFLICLVTYLLGQKHYSTQEQNCQAKVKKDLAKHKAMQSLRFRKAKYHIRRNHTRGNV